MSPAAGPNDLRDAVREALREHGLLMEAAPVLVAVSGGLDSVVLAHLLQGLGHPVTLAHVHHGLRGEEADADLALLRRLADAWACPLVSRRLFGLREADDSLQAAAREARYAALCEMATEAGIPRVATAHHRDDQAETVLLQVLRGTGPAGLAGVARLRPMKGGTALIRPLLQVPRADLEAYAARERLEWREDKTNRDTSYRRNAIRLQVLPMIREALGTDPRGPLARTGTLMAAYENAEHAPIQAALLAAAGLELPGEGGLLRHEVLEALPAVWRGDLYRAALDRWLDQASVDMELLQRIDALRITQPGRRIPVDSGAVWRERTGLAFVRERTIPEPVALEAAPAVFGNWELRLQVGGGSGHGAWARVRPASGAWTVRAWQAGDRIRPLGGRGSRKVKDLLTDAQVPAFARAAHPVVTLEDRVVWVVGSRIDESFAPADEAWVLQAVPHDASP